MSVVRTILDSFWTPKVWLPPNITWADLVPNDKIRYTDHTHLYYPLPMALGMLALRYLLEWYVFAPFGISLGIKGSKSKKPAHNDLLEKAYKQNNKMKYKELTHIAKQTDMSERQIERWLRLRKAQEKPSTLIKFCENSWRCTYYTYSFVYGLYCLWDKPWLWNIDKCWTNYPHQTRSTMKVLRERIRYDELLWTNTISDALVAVLLQICYLRLTELDMELNESLVLNCLLYAFQSVTDDTWWYYMVSLSFYWSLTVSQFRDVKRKDFWQMFVHHIATILLMAFSWICNLVRVGTLVLLVHDCADIFLEAAKMAKYAKYQKVCDTLFAIFTVLWLITRLGIFPFWIINSTAIRAPRIVNTMFPAYYIFNGLLFLLLALHIFWTHLILKIAYNAISAGQMEGDIRSSSSEELSDASTNSTNNTAKLKAQ